MDFTKFIKLILDSYVFETLLYKLSYVKKKMKLPILDIDNQNTTYVFALEATHTTYLNFNPQ